MKRRIEEVKEDDFFTPIKQGSIDECVEQKDSEESVFINIESLEAEPEIQKPQAMRAEIEENPNQTRILEENFRDMSINLEPNQEKVPFPSNSPLLVSTEKRKYENVALLSGFSAFSPRKR